MQDKEIIILMSKLASYDKKKGIKDKKITSYFLHDYIYIENFKNKIFAFLGLSIIMFFYWTHKIITGKINILDLNIQSFVIVNGAIIFAVLFMYSIFGTIRANKEYNISKKRMDRYLKALRMLNSLKTNEQESEETF